MYQEPTATTTRSALAIERMKKAMATAFDTLTHNRTKPKPSPTVAKAGIEYIDLWDEPGNAFLGIALSFTMSDGEVIRTSAQDIDDELVAAAFDNVAQDLIGLTKREALDTVHRAESGPHELPTYRLHPAIF